MTSGISHTIFIERVINLYLMHSILPCINSMIIRTCMKCEITLLTIEEDSWCIWQVASEIEILERRGKFTFV